MNEDHFSTALAEQLRAGLDEAAPPVTSDEASALGALKDRDGTEPRLRQPQSPRRRLVLSLTWTMGLLLLIAAGVGIGLNASGGSQRVTPVGKPVPTKGRQEPRLSVHIDIAKTIASGSQIKAYLVVVNRGPTINLTSVVAPEGTGANAVRCEPAFGIYLVSKKASQLLGFALPCSNRPFLIKHGTNRLLSRVYSDYSGCGPAGQNETVNEPTCTPQGVPPLPLGTYEAMVGWSAEVPLPNPTQVPVTIVAAHSTPS